MAKELKGKVKEKLWVRPVCTDDSDGFRSGQGARRSFKTECNSSREPIDVISPDFLAEADELGETIEDAINPMVDVTDDELRFV